MAGGATMKHPILVLKDINKYFSEDFALCDINLDLYSGEVHIIVGENGSGKSTIMKIISGIVKSDSGHIFFHDQEVCIHSVYEAKKMKIHYALQDVALYPNLTVAENVFADRMPYTNKVFKSVDFNKLYYDCEVLFSKLGIDLDIYTPVRKLGFAQKHLIEVIKAYVSDAEIIIFDEPSASFTSIEKEILYRIIEDLKQKGKAIFYITHLLEEIKILGDRVTVLYQGKITGTKKVKEMKDEHIIEMLCMSKDKKCYPKLEVELGKTILSVDNLYFNNILKNISFQLKKGEILGITGLMGSGRSLLAKCLFGVENYSKGRIKVNDKFVTIKNPSDAIRAGIALIPEDRLNNSVFGCLNLQENISISSLKRFANKQVIDYYILGDVTGEYVRKLSIKPGKPEDLLWTYSGGNQQKMAIARWMMSRLKIYIMDEPTRGIDIASKTDIYNCMVDLIRKGASIIFISSDIEEILGICDRILVLNAGQITCNILRKEATKEKILFHAMSLSKANENKEVLSSECIFL